MKKLKANQIAVFSVFLILLEIIIRALLYKTFFVSGTLYTIVFLIPLSFIFMLITLLPVRVNKICFYVLTSFFTIYFAFQYCFYHLFSTPFSFTTIGLADQAVDFSNVVLDTIIANWWQLLLIFMPLIFVIIFHKHINFKKYNLRHGILFTGIILLSYGAGLLCLLINKKEQYSAYNLYYNVNSDIDNYKTFGVITSSRLDIKRLIFGFEEKIILEDLELNTSPTIIDPLLPIVKGDNKIDIDFDGLISNTSDQTLTGVHEYFKNQEPTNKNQYTGYYKGKNLIFILAEGFNNIAVSEELTPTLYKMSNNSFVFENFYSPVFLSTIGGEFQAVTGLIPNQEILTNWKKNMVSNPYALGHAFNKIGYNTQSYHDWTYTYYGRNKYMQNIGFNNYLGCNNGMEKLINCKWLPSDIEMMDKTVDLYATNTPFTTYYVTVSGHAPYVLTNGNSIALKNKDLVKDLPYSTEIKAYLSTQIELDKALETLINKLTIAGVMDDTVIALVGDHYPYTLSTDLINEISSYNRDGIVEVNRSNFIIYNPSTPKTVIKKTGSQIDALPTLLNLFGIEYDSRLIVGRDILSNQEGLAIFSNRSWVSDSGTYYASSRKFVPKEGISVSDDYVSTMNKIVANDFTMSKYIINYDYYKMVLGE